ncbi:hypothetical protein FE257_010370 [Aspergillus nanangensis]|uniref:Uncharacterized protein n=1 Tax=Aspergillus nanangensis TaxID=2582783 RepID=A0AAD4CJ56_ASPNN|nr:hypothetical protein FE257_010370 [Aspergillus nanangensis]
MWLAKRGITTRVIESRPDEIRIGGADGIKSRSMEIFDSFGIAQEILNSWEPFHHWAMWKEDNNGVISRQATEPLEPPVSSRWGEGALQQAVIETLMKRHLSDTSDVAIQHGTVPMSLTVDKHLLSNPIAYPCVVTLDSHAMIRAKYIIGADGASSWTRKQCRLAVESERTQAVWGVIDMRVTSDFPDIEKCTTIYNHGSGGLLFVRRERGLSRFYIQLTDGGTEGFVRDLVNQDLIIDRIQRRLKPFKLDVEYCEWWSTFAIARSLSERMAVSERIFLVGDAVHSHTPLGGLGMNTAIQDAYNLGWKLAGVIKGELKPEILESYEVERQPVATELLEIDRILFRSFSRDSDETGARSMEDSERVHRFFSGCFTRYPPTMLTSSASEGYRPGQVTIGMRLPDMAVSSCDPPEDESSLLSLLPADGRFHLVVFSMPHGRLELCGVAIQSTMAGLLQQTNGNLNIIVLSSPDRGVKPAPSPTVSTQHNWAGLPEDSLVWVYSNQNYGTLGVDDCTAVVVRPDHHVGWRGSVSDVDGLEGYFRGVFVARGK